MGLAYDEVPDCELPQLTAERLLYRPDPQVPLLAHFAGARAARRAGTTPVGRPRAALSVNWGVGELRMRQLSRLRGLAT
jgi:hypothetical protein